IRDDLVTGVQTCALPISMSRPGDRSFTPWLAECTAKLSAAYSPRVIHEPVSTKRTIVAIAAADSTACPGSPHRSARGPYGKGAQIGRASWRGRGGSAGGA